MQEHRKPPKPDFYFTCGNGSCRWCGEAILKKDGVTVNARASWHPVCVTAYRLIHFPNDTRRAVWLRDKGECYLCGSRVGRKEWELEHIRPLFEAEGRIEFWEMPNLGTACRPCHREKSAKEAGERAAKKRAAKK